jgi:hypothetical protein
MNLPQLSGGVSTKPLRKPAILALLAMNFAVAVSQESQPERVVQGSTIISQHDPAMRIELPREAQYLGADRWILYGIADCEIHVFVEADLKKQVRRLYWVQFEQFVSSRPELQHNYKPQELATFAGSDTYVRARFGKSGETVKEGSDLEHVLALIRAKGYTLPAEMMNVRLVRLLDPQGRKELMIIYSEDLAPTGVKVDDLMPAGKAIEKWPEIQKALVDRAERQIHLLPLS